MSNNTDLSKIIEESSKTNSTGVSDIDNSTLILQLDLLKAIRYKQDTADRKWLAIWAASSVTLWLFSVMLLLFFNNNKFVFKIPSVHFLLDGIYSFEIAPKLSNEVLITLLGTTTLNVLGLSYIVLRGHFKASEAMLSENSLKDTLQRIEG